MTCLLYGIVLLPSAEPRCDAGAPGMPPGVGGSPVHLIEQGGIGAAVSGADPADVTLDVARALAHAGVVEALHARGAVLPMRFGCVFETESQVIELLRARGGEFAACLGELEDCVEMSIRILSGEGEGGTRDPGGGQSAEPRLPGAAYLARRSAWYAEQESSPSRVAEAMDRIRAAFAGLFVKCKAESPASRVPHPAFRVPIPALHFLVRRGALDEFRLAFRQMDRGGEARILLSGPWPPYNFVASGQDGNGRG